MIFLRSLHLSERAHAREEFPFHLPILRSLDSLEFTTPVTFFVGENGSGKSTLLEGIAAVAKTATIGGTEVQQDKTLDHARALGKELRLAWGARPKGGFFLRAEDFFGFAKRLRGMREELDQLEGEFEQNLTGYGRMLATGSVRGQKASMERLYGKELDARSHGESFLKLFQSRFIPRSLYLLDEPEAPLSPQRQLALLVMIQDMVEEECQFLIATHSPILMALPGATLLSFDQVPIKPVAYEDLEHVSLTREFLNAPERFLRHLRNPEV